MLGERGLKGLAWGLNTNSLALGLSLEWVTVVAIFSISSCGLLISAAGLMVMVGGFWGWCGGGC